MRAVYALLATLLAAPAAAAPCDKFSDPLAYNACLARQGPAARALPLHARGASRRVGIARPHGRAQMVFTPGK